MTTPEQAAQAATDTPPPVVMAGAGGGGRPRRGARPETLARGRETYAAQAAGRYEDYAWLRTEQGHSIRQAAERVGITFRHAQRYERRRLDDLRAAVAS